MKKKDEKKIIFTTNYLQTEPDQEISDHNTLSTKYKGNFNILKLTFN